MNYYNEFDPKAAAWLRELIAHGHIPNGIVDERSITEIRPSDLRGFTQCHFFAGIGGWAYALQLANWPAERPVGTGSCPCQPFSDAGKGLGAADPRHLWPVFFKLIVECRALGQQWAFTIFGEQVASKAALAWLDGVFADLENADYACGAADLCAAGVGAPQIRQRIFWVARADGRFPGHGELQRGREYVQRAQDPGARGVGYTSGTRSGRDAGAISGTEGECGLRGQVHGNFARESGSASPACGLGDADGEGHAIRVGGGRNDGTKINQAAGETTQQTGPWSDYDLLPCTDGKTRRIEPGSFPLAHGVSGRVGLLRGYGNAIVPQVAAGFIAAYLATEAYA